MTKFNNIMVDLETTGLNSGRNAMIQIAAYRFGMEPGQIDPQPFNRCLHIPAWRCWNPGTQQWWHRDNTMRGILQSIQARAEDPKTVMADFVDWVLESDNPTFWSKPTHFDWGFIQSYCEDYGLVVPFHYRFANDMNSFLRGMYHPAPVPDLKVPMRGDAHDAVYDVLNQIEQIWAHVGQFRIQPTEGADEQLG